MGEPAQWRRCWLVSDIQLFSPYNLSLLSFNATVLPALLDSSHLVLCFPCLCLFFITRGEVTNGGFGLVLDGSEVNEYISLSLYCLKISEVERNLSQVIIEETRRVEGFHWHWGICQIFNPTNDLSVRCASQR